MKWLFDFISSFFTILWQGFLWLVEAICTAISYAFYLVYDGLLTVVTSFVATLDLSSLAFNHAVQYSSLPPQLIWLMNQINFPQGFSIIAASLTIRMILNLIPAAFTRV